jgi:hypothetical protein
MFGVHDADEDDGRDEQADRLRPSWGSGAGLAVGEEGKDRQNRAACCANCSEHDRHRVTGDNPCRARAESSQERNHGKISRSPNCIIH